MVGDIISLARIRQVELQHGWEPVLRRPRIESILVVAGFRGGVKIDSLSFVRIRNRKDVSERPNSEHEAQYHNDEPGTVEEGRGFRSDDVGSASKEKNEGAPYANEDDCCSRGAVARVPLVDQEMFRYAIKIESRAVEVDSKCAAGSVV